jgi:hypothetical protein
MIMYYFAGGLVVFVAAMAAFWWALPKGDKLMPLVGTVWEPYVAIAITMGAILGFGAMAVAIADYFV